MRPSQPVEAIVESRSPEDKLLFKQLYVNRDRQKAEAFIRKTEKLGFSSIWITVDSPVLGKRERDDKPRVQVRRIARSRCKVMKPSVMPLQNH